ncbi:hypothetical protein [Streptomyces sp. NPDC059761]|uniref:hypothetical protein n=1 Tax=Streptomyces sp. NPDC059761 TaxID=3346937 RepID=UPI00365647A0
MPQTKRAVVGAANTPVSPAAEAVAGTAALSTSPGPGRLTLAHAVLLAVFPILGTVLFLLGRIPVPEILHLLGGCGLIGAGVTAAVTGGRRLAGSAGAALAAGLQRLDKQG